MIAPQCVGRTFDGENGAAIDGANRDDASSRHCSRDIERIVCVISERAEGAFEIRVCPCRPVVRLRLQQADSSRACG